MTDPMTDDRGTARVVLASVDGDSVELLLPHTEYRLRLRKMGDGGDMAALVGKRVRGVIEGRALRIHPAAGGGCFIEPVIGEPRIVAGKVCIVDPVAGRLLVDVSVPMWLTTEPNQDYDVLNVGSLVNCHVESGATFGLV